MHKDVLEEALKAGLSLKQIADELGVNRTTVRHYMKKYELEANFLPGNKQLFDGECRCSVCHDTDARNFYTNNRYRCKRCETVRVTEYRTKRKYAEVTKRGGCCSLCGYNKYIGALEFHHTDPSEKEFDWSVAAGKSQAAIDKELEKCILVCANCHREIHFM